MHTVNFNFYKTGTGKQKAFAHGITQNIINGYNSLTSKDYKQSGKLLEEAYMKCVMITYAEKVKKGEIDPITTQQFIQASNEAVWFLNQAMKKPTVKEKRQALIELVPDALVIINFRHNFSTLDWIQIAYIYLMDQALNLNMRVSDYRIRCCLA